jgi:hypothetical protein
LITFIGEKVAKHQRKVLDLDKERNDWKGR